LTRRARTAAYRADGCAWQAWWRQQRRSQPACWWCCSAGPADRPAIAGTTPQQSGSGDHATAAQQNSRPAPIRIEQVGATAPAEEVVLRDDNPPMRRLRQQVVRHVRWIDRQRHIQIEWNIPSEQTILVPLEYN